MGEPRIDFEPKFVLSWEQVRPVFQRWKETEQALLLEFHPHPPCQGRITGVSEDTAELEVSKFSSEGLIRVPLDLSRATFRQFTELRPDCDDAFLVQWVGATPPVTLWKLK